MLKETETEETIVFFYEIFIIGTFQLGGPGPPGPPPWLRLCPQKKFCPRPRQNQLYVYSGILIS